MCRKSNTYITINLTNQNGSQILGKFDPWVMEGCLALINACYSSQYH